MSLENAIIKTLAYSDIFDYPLKADELHRFLVETASKRDIEKCASKIEAVSFKDGYYYLTGRSEIVGLRKDREAVSMKVFKRAMFYGRILGTLPFIRMAALTGSLAMLNLSKSPDMDFMLVTKQGRVWTARAFAILLGKISRLFGDILCPNLIVSESALEWPLHDLYSAHELCQMIPVTGYDMYLQLFSANTWTKLLLPNAKPKTVDVITQKGNQKKSDIWKIGEFPLNGIFGERFEAWEKTRKIKKFSNQAGFGTETVFTADVCQGNFHHHRKWTHDVYHDCLSMQGIEFNKDQ